MKSLSSFELYYIVNELKPLVDSKVDKIYQENDTLILSLYKSDKFLLKITSSAVYLTNSRLDVEKPQRFALLLRKYLSQARLRDIAQHGFERILEFHFEKKEKYVLIVELFGSGNVVLCDSNNKIIDCLHKQVWRHRTVKPSEIYSYPPSNNLNPFNLKPDDLKVLPKDTLVKSLALDFNLGGLFAEEICFRAGIDKTKKQLDNSEIAKLLSVLKDLKDASLNPNLVSANVLPFEFLTSKPIRYFDNFSSAIDFFDSNVEVVDSAYAKKLAKINTIIEKQKVQIEILKEESSECKLAADLIYNNYAYVKEVFDAVKLAREKKVSWEEIAKKLKTKGIEVKMGKVTLELE